MAFQLYIHRMCGNDEIDKVKEGRHVSISAAHHLFCQSFALATPDNMWTRKLKLSICIICNCAELNNHLFFLIEASDIKQGPRVLDPHTLHLVDFLTIES